ncbi:hypothetical protein [Cupriavidus metallidurans]
MSDFQPVFQSEMQLMNWGESSSNGAWVKFWIHPDDLAVFRDMKCKSGKIAGQRFACVLVEIGDDELPVQEAPAEPAPAPVPAVPEQKGGALAKLAGMWCAEPEFWRFLASDARNGNPQDAEQAKHNLYRLCGITSRAELDHDSEAAARFHSHIRLPYMRWKQGRSL